jgi:trigger factor
MMKTKAKKLEACTTLVEIEVPKVTIEKAFEEVYDEIVKIANIPGFRVGKAPRETVKKHYAKDAKEEVLKRLIPEAYSKAIEEHKLSPIGLPEITDVKFEDGASLLFNAKVTSRPEFKLKEYKGIPVKKKKADVGEADVQKTLESLRELHARYVDPEDRPVQMGDYVVSDLECTVDGKPAHKKRENLWLFVEKESTIPGLAEKLVGMKKLDEIDAEITLPQNYPDKSLAGKKAVYHVKAKEIKVRELPALDDELAKKLGKETIAEVNEEVRKELSARAAMSAEIDAENQVVDKLTADNVFAVPANFVARQLEHMVEDSKRRLAQKGFRREDLDKNDSQLKEKFKADAERKVRLLFILDEIASREKIEATEKDIDTAYRSIASQSGKSPEEVRAYYEKEEIVDGLSERIKEEKTLKFLMDNAQVA